MKKVECRPSEMLWGHFPLNTKISCFLFQGKGLMQTFWLLQENERKSRKSHHKTEDTRSAADKESN